MKQGFLPKSLHFFTVIEFSGKPQKYGGFRRLASDLLRLSNAQLSPVVWPGETGENPVLTRNRESINR